LAAWLPHDGLTGFASFEVIAGTSA